MDLIEWILELEPIEQAYARQCFRFWNGTNGDRQPLVPDGMSQARADIIRYHVKAFINGRTGHRKLEEKKPTSIRFSGSLKKQLIFESAERDLSLSDYVIKCTNAGRPLVRAFPEQNFSNPKITR